jgi:class 3 adenylate cyclase/tetratricopeptide (TPR) repeat protein
MDVIVWLRGLGLGRYEAAFRDNEIDETVLPSLTPEDLKELGITALGHRRKLLDGIAALRIDANVKASPAETPSENSTQEAAERRQVTVMFSDLVGSTALSARLDPEDLREIISAYQKCVAGTVQRFGGFVAKYMGDGVLVYFGYPQAHEDDAERAVRAGLDLVTAVSQLKRHARLQTRVGIATGLVVVGDLIGSGASQEQAIVGETPNVAARLQGVADPNTVVIAESTRKLLGNLFELQDLGAREVKGIAEPVRAWAALRTSSVESRFEALHGTGLTALIGREEELELLLRRWSKAKTSEGQVVLLSGEAGIGKSRLTAALLESLTGEPHTSLRYFCSPQHTDSALYPIIGRMERAAGFVHDDTPQAKLDKLDAVLAQTATRIEDAALFAEMLLLPHDRRYPALELTPPQRRQKTLEALVLQVVALSRQNPVLMIFEDAHWTDPTSLELFGRIVDRIRNLHLLLIVTFRPEFESPWIGRPYVTALTINRLGEREIAAMIDRVTGNRLLSAKVRHDIVERTDGIPLFVEEMTKAVLEAESEEAARRTAAPMPSLTLAVPASLQASLMARLDRLGPAKDVAQIGAVIGREFAYDLLAQAARKSDEQLYAALSVLGEAGLVYCQGTLPQATFQFKHALIRDAAYGSLLRKTREEVHVRIARVLEGTLPDTADIQPELIAHHYTEAGCKEEAVRWWHSAGQRASHRSANAEAVAHLNKALELIGAGAEGNKRDLLELKVRVDVGGPLIGSKGWGASELEENYTRAWALYERTGATELAFPVLWGQYVSAGYRAEGGLALSEERAERFLQLAKRQGDAGLEVMGHRMLGVQLVSRGQFVTGRQHLERAVALYDPTKHQGLAFTYGINPRVSALVTLSLTLQYLGFVDQASRAGEQGVEEARQSDHFNSLGVALHLMGRLRAFRREGAQLRNLACDLIALSREQGSTDWGLAGEILLGWQEARDGCLQEGLERIRRGVEGLRARKLNVWLPAYLLLQAEICCDAGQFDETLELLDEAKELIELQEHPVCEAELHRLRACAELSRGASAEVVEACFDRAFAVARGQSAKFWELRTAVSRAGYWRDRGKYAEARDLLAPIYGWFSEGFDTPDLKEAKVLLNELAV